MTTRGQLALTSILLLAGAPVARAQDKGSIGITMGFPASLGLVWHVTDNVAVRPELSVSGGHSDSNNSDSTSLGTGVSLLVYGKGRDNVRPYVSPRFSYAHGTLQTDVVTSPSGTTTRLSSSNNAWNAGGCFGAQYSPNKRFSVFGEVGFGYGQTESTPLVTSQTVSKLKASSWSTRTGVGMILYF